MNDIEILYSSTDITRYKNDWERLYSLKSNQPSVSYQWTTTLLKSHFKPDHEFILIVIRKNNMVTCIAPLVLYKSRFLIFSINILFPLSEYYRTHGDILIDDTDTDAYQKLFIAISQINKKWHFFKISRVMENNPIFNNLQEYSNIYRHRYRIHQEYHSYFIELPNNYPDYLTMRSAKFRNNLKRLIKRLKALGDFEIVQMSSSEHAQKIYETILDIELKSWKHENKSAISNLSQQQTFISEMLDNVKKNEYIHFHFLQLNSEPIAYNLGYISNETYYYLRTSFSEKYRYYNPSTILRSELIKSLIESSHKKVDFLGEPYSWEKQWASTKTMNCNFKLYNKDMVSTAIYLKGMTTIACNKLLRNINSAKADKQTY